MYNDCVLQDASLYFLVTGKLNVSQAQIGQVTEQVMCKSLYKIKRRFYKPNIFLSYKRLLNKAKCHH